MEEPIESLSVWQGRWDSAGYKTVGIEELHLLRRGCQGPEPGVSLHQSVLLDIEGLYVSRIRSGEDPRPEPSNRLVRQHRLRLLIASLRRYGRWGGYHGPPNNMIIL